MTFEQYIQDDLILYQAMTEEEACKEYNVDSKEEALSYIIDYWIMMT